MAKIRNSLAEQILASSPLLQRFIDDNPVTTGADRYDTEGVQQIGISGFLQQERAKTITRLRNSFTPPLEKIEDKYINKDNLLSPTRTQQLIDRFEYPQPTFIDPLSLRPYNKEDETDRNRLLDIRNRLNRNKKTKRSI